MRLRERYDQFLRLRIALTEASALRIEIEAAAGLLAETTLFGQRIGDRSFRPTGLASTPADVETGQVEGYEADDFIATLTTRAAAAGMDVLSSSGDRDCFQLVTDQVTLLYPCLLYTSRCV